MYIRKIKDLLNKKEHKKAELLCIAAIKEMPNTYIYYELLATIYFNTNEKNKSKEIVNKGLKIKNDSIILNNLLYKINKNNKKNTFAGRYTTLPPSIARTLEGGLRYQKKNAYQKIKSSNQEPLISIITAVYNNDNSFERCIKSVFNQTYKNIEYIIIDGGSEKPTIDLIKKYSDKIDYFVSEPDSGIYHAMNKGISVSQGDYICLLNSDDYYEPDFIEISLQKILITGADVSYCNYNAGNTELIAENVSVGVLLGHLNICHNTFLVSKQTYDKIGYYSENLRIISDAVWIRKAYKEGVKFAHVDKTLFTLSDGGLSSGANEEHRRLFINEVSTSYVIQFPFLSMEESEELYLFRFNNKRLLNVLKIAERHIHQREFISALKAYIEYCFKSRNNFKLSHTESNGLFLIYIKAVELLDVNIMSININTKHGLLSDVLGKLKSTIDNKKINFDKVILHFVSVFSAPSETFIYDLLLRLQNSTKHDNFVLFEHTRLTEERPFKNSLHVPWNDFRPEIASQIYKFIFKQLNPDLIIAHFALNEWKLNKRISPLGIELPTLTMTHGIDVFSMKSDLEYKDYIINDFSKRNNTHFTCVSDYLLNELSSQGVTPTKISRVYNTANPEFLNYRKENDFFDYKRELRILSVGRCIDWKGHTDLIYGFSLFIKNTYKNAKLTIIYGNGIDNLSEVQSAVKLHGIEDKVELIPFVDFSIERDYFSKFDIYIQASKYTQDELRKSETFGVATLEAILSGLPIIVTDAGGLPEVAGSNTKHSIIVKHQSGKAIYHALEQFYETKDTFTDNKEYAEERASFFAENKQLSALDFEIRSLCNSKIRVAMFSTSTIQGAGYAAFRLFKGLRDLSALIEPTMFTTVRNHENEEGIVVVKHPSGDGKRWQEYQKPENSKPGMTIFTYSHPVIANEILWEWVKDYDVINIHWTARFLSVDNIAYLTSLGKPVIMTIRDMQPITGGCHFFHGCDKWKTECGECHQLLHDQNNFSSQVIKAKRELYNFNNLTLVALSSHTKSILQQAPLFNKCQIEVIPNSIETEIFKPTEKRKAREILGLPLDRKLIGYVPSFSSEVKGYREVIKAFEIINDIKTEKPMVVLVGNKTPADDEICLDKLSLGYISDNEKLALTYSAVDVVVVPSLEETFSNTTAESISCGTPVIGFKTGAIPDLAVENISGQSFEIGDVEGLASGIISILEHPLSAKKCRAFAQTKLQFNFQTERYERLFFNLLANTSNQV
jgi:glycosyltransferase involved in cell wall biosynthesis